jgi:hypothetical protein
MPVTCVRIEAYFNQTFYLKTAKPISLAGADKLTINLPEFGA